jgi:predicted DNA-binding antitoxin AbrB/MazE fold protein
MMAIVVEATFENGVLKPSEPLPLKEHEKVRLTIESSQGWAERTYGMLGWKGDHETLEQLLAEAEEDML